VGVPAWHGKALAAAVAVAVAVMLALLPVALPGHGAAQAQGAAQGAAQAALMQNGRFAIAPDPNFVWRDPGLAAGLYVWGHGKA
jgi:hypothetical protein